MATGDKFDEYGRPIQNAILKATDGTDAIGEVQATPTAYTLLRRLKDLLTSIVLAAGSAVIGKVGHDITGIDDGRKTVATAGTRLALASTTAAKLVIVTAYPHNTGIVVVGGANVVAAADTRRGTPLYAGESTPWIPIDDLAEVYIDATLSSSEGATFSYLT